MIHIIVLYKAYCCHLHLTRYLVSYRVNNEAVRPPSLKLIYILIMTIVTVLKMMLIYL